MFTIFRWTANEFIGIIKLELASKANDDDYLFCVFRSLFPFYQSLIVHMSSQRSFSFHKVCKKQT